MLPITSSGLLPEQRKCELRCGDGEERKKRKGRRAERVLEWSGDVSLRRSEVDEIRPYFCC